MMSSVVELYVYKPIYLLSFSNTTKIEIEVKTIQTKNLYQE